MWRPAGGPFPSDLGAAQPGVPAMCAAAVAGIYPSIEEARDAMTAGFEKEYTPIAKNAKIYKKLYERYSKLSELIEKDTMEEAK